VGILFITGWVAGWFVRDTWLSVSLGAALGLWVGFTLRRLALERHAAAGRG